MKNDAGLVSSWVLDPWNRSYKDILYPPIKLQKTLFIPKIQEKWIAPKDWFGHSNTQETSIFFWRLLISRALTVPPVPHKAQAGILNEL